MFSDKKYVVCSNSLFLGASKPKLNHNIDDLIDYINNPVKTTIIIFIVNLEKLDSRKKVNTLLNKCADIIECNEMSSEQIFNYTKNIFVKNNINISDSLIKYLIDRVNSDINFISNEVNKLILYDELITKEVIDDLVFESIDDNIFNFIDSIMNNDKKKMFSIYEESVKNGLEPIQIIAMLAQEFRVIYQVRILTKKGYLEKDIMNILDIYKIGRIKFAKNKIRNISDEEILEQIEKLADLDILIKTGEIDKFVAFEEYLLAL